MAQIWMCDRCRSTYMVKPNSDLYVHIKGERPGDGRLLDLCARCLDELTEFMKGAKLENGSSKEM